MQSLSYAERRETEIREIKFAEAYRIKKSWNQDSNTDNMGSEPSIPNAHHHGSNAKAKCSKPRRQAPGYSSCSWEGETIPHFSWPNRPPRQAESDCSPSKADICRLFPNFRTPVAYEEPFHSVSSYRNQGPPPPASANIPRLHHLFHTWPCTPDPPTHKLVSRGQTSVHRIFKCWEIIPLN